MTETLARLRKISLDSKAMDNELSGEHEQKEQRKAWGGKACRCGTAEESVHAAPDWMGQWHNDLAQYRTDIEVTGSEKQSILAASQPETVSVDSRPFESSRDLLMDCQPTSMYETARALNSVKTRSSSTIYKPRGGNANADEYSLPSTSSSCCPSFGRIGARSGTDECGDAKPPVPLSPLCDATAPAAAPSLCQPLSDPATTRPNPVQHERGYQCAQCAHLKQELQALRLQLSTQQMTLNGIAIDLACLKTASAQSQPHSAAAHFTPPSHPWYPPWRSTQRPFDHSWAPAPDRRPHSPPQYDPPAAAFPGRAPPVSAPVSDIWGRFPAADDERPKSTDATSQQGPSSLIPEHSPTTAAASASLIVSVDYLHPVDSLRSKLCNDQRNSAPKRVSFACPVTSVEPEQEDEGENAVAPPAKSEVKPSPSLRHGRARPLGKKTSPILKKTSLARPRPCSISGSFKYCPDVYTSKSPRSYYGPTSKDGTATEDAPHFVQPKVISDHAALAGKVCDPAGPINDLPFVRPAKDRVQTRNERLKVRLDGPSLLQFMHYWQPRGAGGEPLFADLSLDPMIYEEFLDWAHNTGTIEL